MNIHIYLSLQKFTCDFFLAAHFLYHCPYPLQMGLYLGVSMVSKGQTAFISLILDDFNYFYKFR